MVGLMVNKTSYVVEPTHLKKDIRQTGSFLQVGVK